MSFELDERGAAEIDQRAHDEGVPLGSGIEPGFFAGMLTAPIKGLARGTLGKSAVLVGDSAFPLLRPAARAVDAKLGTALDQWLTDEQRRNLNALEDWSVDPTTIGFAGRLLHGFVDLGSSAAIYTPEGAAVLEGYGRRAELIKKGVDAETATLAGAVSGAAAYVGVKAPITLGQGAAGQGLAAVARNVGYGAALSATAGVAERGTMHDLLARAGYSDQAVLYEPYDATALATETVLGGLFSGSAAAIEARSSKRGQVAIDAALAVRQAKHAALDSAPGVPADSATAGAHRTAVQQAVSQVLRNERVNVGDPWADTAFVRGDASATRESRQELQLHVADLLPEPGSFKPGTDAPRGVANNNPGNLRASGERWQGQTGSDGQFVTFDTPEAGIRALARTLLTYQQHGINTVEGIVNRWAPPTENDTAAYVRTVAGAIGLEPTTPLDLHDAQTLQQLATAIIHHENGRQPYSESVIRAGVEAALGRPSAEGAGVAHAVHVAEQVTGTRDSGPVDAEAAPSRTAELPGNRAREGATGRIEPDAAHQAEPSQNTSESAAQPPTTASKPASADTRLPRVSELDPVAVGPAVVKPREIASGRQLYRETSVQGLSDLLMNDQRAHVRDMFVADSQALALGQGENKGVQIVFRDGALSGAEHRKPGTGDATGREYRTDLVAPRAIESFTVPAGFKPQVLRGLAQRALADFDAAPQADGSTVYTRKALPEAPPVPADRPTVEASARRPGSDMVAGDGAPQLQPQPAAPHAEAGPTPAAASATAAPTMRAAEQALAIHPDLRVVLEDGTELSARDLLARMAQDRQRAQQDAKAFDAAVNCFLTT